VRGGFSGLKERLLIVVLHQFRVSHEVRNVGGVMGESKGIRRSRAV